MNCMSVQQEKKTYQQHNQAYQQSNNNTTSRAGLRSCLRGEIEDTECKIELFLLIIQGLRRKETFSRFIILRQIS